jgi:hypothetical protein
LVEASGTEKSGAVIIEVNVVVTLLDEALMAFPVDGVLHVILDI